MTTHYFVGNNLSDPSSGDDIGKGGTSIRLVDGVDMYVDSLPIYPHIDVRKIWPM